jgi:vitamin B12 transporter
MDTVKMAAFQVEASRVSIPDAYTSVTFDSIILSQHGFGSMAELLSSSTPIYIKDYGLSGVSSLSLRGTGASHTQVYWNGFVLNSPMLGQVDASLIPVALIDQVELHQGAGSVMDGSGGLGGSIQIANLPDWDNRYTVAAENRYGSFETHAQQIKVKWGTSKWQLHSSFYRKRARNDFEYKDYHQNNRSFRRKNAEITQFGGMQEIYHRLNSRNIIMLRAWYSESERNLPPILGLKTKAEEQIDRSLRTMLEWQNMGRKYLMETKIGAFQDKLNYVNDTLQIASESEMVSYQYYQRYTRYMDPQLKAIAQLQLREEQALSSGFSKRRNQRVVAGLAGLSWSVWKQRTVIDGYSRQELGTDEAFYWIPSLGVKHRLFSKKQWYVSGSAAKNVHYPTLNDLYWDELGNPLLKVEQGQTLEGGLANEEIKIGKRHCLSVGSTVFYTEIDNWILWYPEGGVWRPANLRAVENKGVELFLRIASTFKKAKASFFFNYANVVAKQLEGNGTDQAVVGKQLIYVPRHKINGNFSWHYSNWFGSYRQGYHDNVFIDAQNSRYLPFFTVAEVSLGKSFSLLKGKWTLQGSVKNIYNETYQVVAERPMPGRHYSIQLRIQFNTTQQ